MLSGVTLRVSIKKRVANKKVMMKVAPPFEQT